MPAPIESTTSAAYSAAPAFSVTISRGVPGWFDSASSTISFDSSASATRNPRLLIIDRPKSSG